MMKQLIYQSKKIHYRVIGKGKPIVLIHGFGEDGDIWQYQTDVLKNDHLLIVPDLPGSGLSEIIPDMSMEGMAEMIKAIMDIELRDTQANILGHSMGGYITLAFAEKHPNLLSSLGLIHSSAFSDTEEKKITRRKAIDFIQKNGAYEFLKTSIPDLFFKGEASASTSDRYMQTLVEKGRNFSPTALIAYYNAMIQCPDRTEVLKTFTGPILFIIGRHDKAVSFEQSMQQCYLPHRSDVNILRNSAHMGMLEEVAKTNEVINLF